MDPFVKNRARKHRRYGKKRATSPSTTEESGPSYWKPNVEKEYLSAFIRFLGRAMSSLVESGISHSNLSSETNIVIGAGTSFKVFPMAGGSTSVSTQQLGNMVVKAVHQATDLGSWEERFNSLLNEIRVLTSRPVKNHPNIVQLARLIWTEAASPRGLYYPALVIEGAELGDLSSFQQPDAFSLLFHTKLFLCLDVAEGLSFLHQCGIIHGDVKPANVLLFDSKDGSGIPRAKISDFSHSLFECDAKDGFLSWLGETRPWSAPETRNQTVQDMNLASRSDIFSFGLIVLFVILEKPDEFLEVFNHINTDDHEPYLAHAIQMMVNDAKDMDMFLLQRIFTGCLAKYPTDRFSSLEESIALIRQGIVCCGGDPHRQSHIPVKLTWSLKQMSNIVNINEACIAQATYSPNVQRQIFNALSYECQRGVDWEDFTEALLQHGICFINEFGNPVCTAREGLEAGLQFITAAAKLKSERAMAILPILHEAFGFPFPRMDFEPPELGNHDGDRYLGQKVCLVMGCYTGSLIALDYSFDTMVGEGCLKAFQDHRRQLFNLNIDSMPFEIDFTNPIILHMQLLSLQDTIGSNFIRDSNGNTVLHFAAANGLTEIVEVIVNTGVPVDVLNNKGESALHHSMLMSHADTTILLLKKGANITLWSKSRGTPLHYISAFRGRVLQQIISSISQDLLTEGVDLDFDEYESATWHLYVCLSLGTPLHWAINRKNLSSAKFLLDHGASPLRENSRGCSPLYYALTNNMIQFLELFTTPDAHWADAVRIDLAAQAEDYALVTLAQQRFQLALTNGAEYLHARRSTLELLRRFSPIDIRPRLLWFAVDRGHLETAHAILEEKPELVDTQDHEAHSMTCLLRSIYRGNLNMFDLLMQYNPVPGFRFGPESSTYLHALPMLAIPAEARVHYATRLIAAGADINAVDTNGLSPILYALMYGQIEYAKTLLEAGATYDQTSKGGPTLLASLIRRALPGSMQGIEYYLENMRSPDDPSFVVHADGKWTALHLASDTRTFDKGILMRLLAEEFLCTQECLDFQDIDGDTALHGAVYSGHVTAVRLLLEAGASRDITNVQGKTPLIIATERHVCLDRMALMDSFRGKGASHAAVYSYDLSTEKIIRLLK